MIFIKIRLVTFILSLRVQMNFYPYLECCFTDFHERWYRAPYRVLLVSCEFHENLYREICTLLIGVREFLSVILIFIVRFG